MLTNFIRPSIIQIETVSQKFPRKVGGIKMIGKVVSLKLRNRDMSAEEIVKLLGEGVAYHGQGEYWFEQRVHIVNRMGPNFDVIEEGPYLERAKRFCV